MKPFFLVFSLLFVNVITTLYAEEATRRKLNPAEVVQVVQQRLERFSASNPHSLSALTSDYNSILEMLPKKHQVGGRE